MGLGLPVVSSPVGDAGRVVVNGVTGFHAHDAKQWQEALFALACCPELRRSMGHAGRQRAEYDYSYQAWAPKIASTLRRLLTART
ncbi:glycosyltransferase [Desulfocurvibacter africanus]|uniref:glycosyltransferase n=1 Tax=Desulfocurvibacter africanus TaxID=873 RepID=UPI00130544E4